MHNMIQNWVLRTSRLHLARSNSTKCVEHLFDKNKYWHCHPHLHRASLQDFQSTLMCLSRSLTVIFRKLQLVPLLRLLRLQLQT
jgi:hypothetical protein